MKRFATPCLLLMAQPVLAGSVTIFNDPCTGDSQCSAYTSTGNPLYHGGNGTDPNPPGDVKGSEDMFDILSLTVSQSGPELAVSIVTRFVPDSFAYPHAGFGDLLLSTTGWHPYGTAPHDRDTATTSQTDWNYVVLTPASTQTSPIYRGAALANSSHLAQDGDYREDQYVGYLGGGTLVGNVLVTIDDALLAGVDTGFLDTLGTRLTYTIPLALLAFPMDLPPQVALRWTTTGANDIVEAAVTLDNGVPEPTSLALCLTGLAAWRRHHRGAA